jgi:DNA-binding FadR family transcriptional regulator
MALILRRLKRIVQRGRATAHVTSDFHQALARAGHNGPLSRMAQILSQARLEQGMRVEHALPDIAAGEYASHRLLLDAIAGRDADRARDAMREHLEIAHGWERRINGIRSELALPAPERPRSRPSN